MMVIEGIRLCHNHIGQIPIECVSPQITDELRPFGILCNIVPMICNLYTHISGAAMYGEPSLMCLIILTVFDEMISSAKRAETFIKDAFL